MGFDFSGMASKFLNSSVVRGIDHKPRRLNDTDQSVADPKNINSYKSVARPDEDHTFTIIMTIIYV